MKNKIGRNKYTIKRRKFLALGAASSMVVMTGCGGGGSTQPTGGGGGGAGGGGTGGGTGGGGGGTTTSVALPIPELKSPVDINGVKHYDLDILDTEHTFFSGVKTKTWAFSSTYLGPTLLLKNGDDVSVNYTNNLSEGVAVHGHGMHLPGDMDGSAHQTIGAGASWSAQYTVNQNACTNWYHPHTLNRTAKQVYQGLAGLIIIEDNDIKTYDLPNRYGVDDIPLVLQDRFFSADKTQLDYSPTMQETRRGYIGDTFITNGAIEPTFEAEAKEIRFRILNGSNSSVYELGFTSGISFKQIGGDNSLLEAPVSMTRLTLSPAERVEIIVDLTNSKGASLELFEYKNSKTFLKINVSKDATATTIVPATLTSLDAVDTSLVSRTRTFTMDASNGNLTINGKSMDLARIDEVVPLGDTEIWEVTNTMGIDHNFHMHGTHFRILERNGSAANVSDNEKGYKDTAYLPGNESVKLLVKMTDYMADSNSPYMYHCHFLEHEDDGMMGQFTVV